MGPTIDTNNGIDPRSDGFWKLQDWRSSPLPPCQSHINWEPRGLMQSSISSISKRVAPRSSLPIAIVVSCQRPMAAMIQDARPCMAWDPCNHTGIFSFGNWGHLASCCVTGHLATCFWWPGVSPRPLPAHPSEALLPEKRLLVGFETSL